jgi:hypothetical protein
MGVDFYTCGGCGETRSDCSHHEWCKCGTFFCSECRKTLRKYADDKFYCENCDDYGEVHVPTDKELLEHVLEKHYKRSRYDAIQEWKSTKKAKCAECVECGFGSCDQAYDRKPPEKENDSDDGWWKEPWGHCCNCAEEEEKCPACIENHDDEEEEKKI